jgi:hypothetical protein
MSISKIYDTWKRKIQQLRPKERISRVKTMAALISGIFVSRSVQLGRVASKLPGHARRNSVVRRLERIVANTQIRVCEWYEPVIRPILNAQVGREFRLVVDGSKVGPWHQLLLVSLAYRRRTIPIAWMWIPRSRGHSSAARQLSLLCYVHELLPEGAQVLLVGDQEFGAIEVLKQLDQWHWQYVLRQKSSELFRPDENIPWKAFGDVIHKAGEQVWLGEVEYTQQHAYSTHLLAYWQIGEPEPWLLATNLTTPQATLRAYRRRAWIEETFGDLKDNGFDLESSRLHTAMHLHRLTLAVMLLYLDMLATGSKVIKNGLRKLVDRSDRRDLSIFRIGLYMRDRCLANDLTFSIHLLPVLCQTVG